MIGCLVLIMLLMGSSVLVMLLPSLLYLVGGIWIVVFLIKIIVNTINDAWNS